MTRGKPLKNPFRGIGDPEQRIREYSRLKRKAQRDGTWWYKQSIYLKYLQKSEKSCTIQTQ
jgi:hypothetical protein